jgi:hypothetical protein
MNEIEVHKISMDIALLIADKEFINICEKNKINPERHFDEKKMGPKRKVSAKSLRENLKKRSEYENRRRSNSE